MRFYVRQHDGDGQFREWWTTVADVNNQEVVDVLYDVYSADKTREEKKNQCELMASYFCRLLNVLYMKGEFNPIDVGALANTLRQRPAEEEPNQNNERRIDLEL